MKFRRSLTVAVVMAASMLAGGSAQAQRDIPFTWNSNDYDIRATFESTGEHIYAFEFNNSSYVDWSFPGVGKSRWWIPGDGNGNEYDNNLTLDEGYVFQMNVCQYHSAFPDDCSGWKYGVS